MDNGTPIQAAGSALPLGVGFLGAVPITLLQRTVRRRLKSRRAPLPPQGLTAAAAPAREPGAAGARLAYASW